MLMRSRLNSVITKNNFFKQLSTTVTDQSSTPRIKHRIPQKRASKLLNELKNEEFTKLKSGRKWPQVRAGDAIEIKRLEYKSAKTPEAIRGVVLGVVNRFSDSSIILLNSEFGTPIHRRIVMYNPLITDVQILQKAFIHGGKKRVRRSKIYYLENRDPEFYTVKYTSHPVESGK